MQAENMGHRLTVTYFYMDADLPSMMYPYTKFDDHTMYSY